MRAVEVRVTVIAGQPRDLQIRIYFDVLRNVRIRRDLSGGKRGHNDAAGKKQGQSRKTDCAGKSLCHAREQQKHHEKEQIVILNGVRADRLCDQRRDREKCRHQDLIQRQTKTVSLPIIQACHKQCNGKKRDAAAICPQKRAPREKKQQHAHSIVLKARPEMKGQKGSQAGRDQHLAPADLHNTEQQRDQKAAKQRTGSANVRPCNTAVIKLCLLHSR